MLANSTHLLKPLEKNHSLNRSLKLVGFFMLKSYSIVVRISNGRNVDFVFLHVKKGLDGKQRALVQFA
jgi:hypothetical protein